MAAAIDDSCRRPGSVPFKWEICPGTPKHTRSSSASAAPPPSSSPSYYSYSSTPTATAFSSSKVAVSPKLTPPPAMSPSPYYHHSPRVVSYSYSSYHPAARSAASSVSQSRRRTAHHRPTAFLDVNPRVAPAYRAAYAADAQDHDDVPAPASRCFPLPAFRRRDSKKGGQQSGTSFRSDGAAPAQSPGGLRRSVSSASSSSCLSLSSRSSGKLPETREVDVAGGWFY